MGRITGHWSLSESNNFFQRYDSKGRKLNYFFYNMPSAVLLCQSYELYSDAHIYHSYYHYHYDGGRFYGYLYNYVFIAFYFSLFIFSIYLTRQRTQI